MGQRRHLPHTDGPRLEKRGQWWTVDLRPWSGRRYTPLRDPSHALWPMKGRKTTLAKEARTWVRAYWSPLDGLLISTEKTKGQKPSTSLGTLTEAYLARREREVVWNTHRNDGYVLKGLMEYAGERTLLEEVDFEGFFEQQKRKLQPNTVRNQLSTIKTFLQAHKALHLLPDVKIARPVQRDPEYMEETEILSIVESAPEPLSTGIAAAYATGVRVSELAMLRWEDFAPQEGTVRVMRQLARGGTRRATHTKSRKGRTVFVLPFWWRRPQQEMGLVCGRPDGEPWSHDWFAENLETHCGRQGWHIFRHSYARTVLRKGVDLQVLQKLLGHAKLATTEVYAHFRTSEALDRVRQAFG